MENRPALVRTHEEACERVAALFSSRWLRHYVAGKLRSDPVFPAVFERLRGSAEPLLDIGCGVGLLAFYLRARGSKETIIGLDIDARKIRRARAISGQEVRDLTFSEQDVSAPLPDFRGNIAVLDLLHYLAPSQQAELLSELAARVAPGGILFLRDSPRDNSVRHWLTHAGETFAQAIAWNLNRPLHFPTRESIHTAFPENEFVREETSCWGNTPFNNRLFIFTRKAL